VNHPQLPEYIIVTDPTAYIRLHGNPQLFYSNYSDEFLINILNNLISNKKIKDAYVFFNNTASTAGIMNAQQFNLNFSKALL